MSRDTFSYTHGDTGTEPSSSLNFEKNERPQAGHFDWYWYEVVEAIKGHASEFDRLDSDDDGIVDEADYAGNADQLDGNHASYFAVSGHDHDGRYYTQSQADSNFAASGHNHDGAYILEAGDTMGGTLTLSDGSTAASQSWVNGNADVPNADHADNAGDADTVDGNHASDFASSGHNHDGRYVNEGGGTGGSLDFGGSYATSVGEVQFSNIESVTASAGALGYDDSEGLLLHDGEAHRVIADGDNLNGGNQVSVSGGQGSGDTPITIAVNENNLDADTVDGNEASAFAASGHDHDGRYYTQSQVDSNFHDVSEAVDAHRLVLPTGTDMWA